ncbi:MAG: hypothetical protein ACXADY_20720 [Candidatus Hodarchaeales archaeon]|jgi:hypothetical protein
MSEKTYPYERKCWCNQTIWIFKNKAGNEYAKDSKIRIQTFRDNDETPDFHEHRDWNAKKSKKQETNEKFQEQPSEEPKDEITQIEALIFIGKQLESLNKILASILPVVLNLKK